MAEKTRFNSSIFSRSTTRLKTNFSDKCWDRSKWCTDARRAWVSSASTSRTWRSISKISARALRLSASAVCRLSRHSRDYRNTWSTNAPNLRLIVSSAATGMLVSTSRTKTPTSAGRTSRTCWTSSRATSTSWLKKTQAISTRSSLRASQRRTRTRCGFWSKRWRWWRERTRCWWAKPLTWLSFHWCSRCWPYS